MKPCVLAYVPPPSFGCADSFYRNLAQFRTKYDLLIYSDYDWPGAIKLKASPEIVKGAVYGNGRANTWAVNNLVFATGLRIAATKGYTHFIYLESDCRVMGDEWDARIIEEFVLAGEGKLVAGSIVAYNPCNRSLSFTRRWRDFIARNAESPFPIPAYGGNGAAEEHEPIVMPNGALGVYDVEFMCTLFDIEKTGAEAGRVTAWDYHIGRELVRKFGDDVFDRIAHLSCVYSSFGNVQTTEEERIRMLTAGEVIGVHQVKSGWYPQMGSVAETDKASDAGGRPAPAGSMPAIAPNLNPDRQPRVSIFIVTYAKDKEWLKFCLRSIAKFATGFLHTTVVVPEKDEPQFDYIPKEFPWATLLTSNEPPPPLGHLHHQVVKCSADQYDRDATWFLYMDADCIFTEPVTPADYFDNRKPVLLVQPYDSLTGKEAGAKAWQAGTEKALGWKCYHETMRRHPAVHHRGLLQEMRMHIEELHKMPFEKYVLSQHPVYPCGYSEFNVMGSFAIERWRETYHFIDIGNAGNRRPHEKLMQFWSHGPMDQTQEIWFNGKLLTIVPKTELTRILG